MTDVPGTTATGTDDASVVLPDNPSRPSIWLSRASVFIDFDGTISIEDVGSYLLERFAPGRWDSIDARYERGDIGSRQYLSELWPLLPADTSALLAVAEEVPLDPGFGPLVAFLASAGAEVVVISDGLGFYVQPRCAPFGVEVLANDVLDGRPVFPHADPSCPCGACGTCKATPIRRARARGRTTIVVGDGTSDRYGAVVADLVFAKDRLIDWCRQSGVPFTRFTTLADVEAALARLATLPSTQARGHPPRAERQ